jgi:rubrerythrin
MSAIDPGMIQLVKEAMRLEVRGRGFFLYAAEVTENELGRKMFRRLADDEVEHMRVFGEMFTAMTGGDEWKKFVRSEEGEGAGIIDDLKKRIEGAAREKRAGDLEAIRIGMELERKAIAFFEKFRNEAKATETKEMAEKIRDQEEGHYEMLQAQYDSVHKSGFWLDSAEFRLDAEY